MWRSHLNTMSWRALREIFTGLALKCVCARAHFYVYERNDQLKDEGIKITRVNKMSGSFFITLRGDRLYSHQSPPAPPASKGLWITKEGINLSSLVFMVSYVFLWSQALPELIQILKRLYIFYRVSNIINKNSKT